MGWISVVAVIISIIIIILAKLSRKSGTDQADGLYQKKDVLFTPAERSFLGVLNQAVNQQAMIFGKVRVADVLVPKKGLSGSEWQKAFNKIFAKHFDFLLCRNDDLSIICAIELNDSSHQSQNRQQRDEFLKRACQTAGVPLIEVPAKSAYVIDDIKQLITPYLGNGKISIRELSTQQESPTNDKVCPKCFSLMVKRVAKKGSNTGKEFWACSSYPACRHTENINA